MTAKVYVKTKDVEVLAEQFLIMVTPWPPQVFEYQGQHIFAGPNGAETITNGDWIMIDEHGKSLVVSAAAFAKSYTAK